MPLPRCSKCRRYFSEATTPNGTEITGHHDRKGAWCPGGFNPVAQDDGQACCSRCSRRLPLEDIGDGERGIVAHDRYDLKGGPRSCEGTGTSGLIGSYAGSKPHPGFDDEWVHTTPTADPGRRKALILAAVAAVPLLVILVGVFRGGESERTTTSSEDTVTADEPTGTSDPLGDIGLGTDQEDQLFVAAVRLAGPFPESDASIAHVGHTICETLQTGADPEDVLGALLRTGITARQAGALLGAAPPSLCPAQEARVNAFLHS